MIRSSFTIRILPLFLALALIPCSCRKLLEVPTPQDEISAGEVFSNDTNALSALTGMYIQIMNNSRSLLNGGITLYGGLSSDELHNIDFPLPNASLDAFRLNQLSPGNLLCDNLYTNAYNIIYTANSLIAGLAGATGVSAGMRSELRGEAEFVRALVYFYLVNLYGDVPLVTTTDFNVSSKIGRTPAAGVYAQIVADLQDAQTVLPVAYISSSAPGDRTRPNQAAARALLARVWLYQGNWAAAEQAADSVIANPLYLLEPSLDSVFLSTSREAIWQLQPVYDTIATAEGNLFLPRGGSPPADTLTSWLQSSWEAGDLRRLHWTDSVPWRGAVYIYPYKYKQANDNAPDAEYNMVLRLAEVYLIRAEARAQQDYIGEAAADLNTVRFRAGLPPTGAADQNGLLGAILQERRVELFAEWGHRWLDLKRTGQADAVLTSEKAETWTGDAKLYPIPATELIYNPKLVQNPGY